jgi:hypothetical protein
MVPMEQQPEQEGDAETTSGLGPVIGGHGVPAAANQQDGLSI